MNGRGKSGSQSFGPEPFENFRTGFYFRSARLAFSGLFEEFFQPQISIKF